jgi:hypothetical protein
MKLKEKFRSSRAAAKKSLQNFEHFYVVTVVEDSLKNDCRRGKGDIAVPS